MDAVSILKPVTKYSVTVGSPAQVGEVLATAFSVAEGGRPGAAYVNMPIDVMAAPNPHSPLRAATVAGLGPAEGKAIAEAARLINTAKNPVVLVGRLASRPANAKALQSFLTNGRLPVVGTFQAAGAVGAPLFDNFGGRVGQLANQLGDRLLDAADLVVTVGYDPVEYWPPEWNGGKTRKIIHLDVLRADLDNDYQARCRTDPRHRANPGRAGAENKSWSGCSAINRFARRHCRQAKTFVRASRQTRRNACPSPATHS
jgi:acetolactate synthase-1/2/3 large subunit